MKSCSDHIGRQLWHWLFGHPRPRRRIYFGAPDAYVELDDCFDATT